MKLLLFFLWLCCCASKTYSETGFQSWVTDPQYSLYPTLPNVAPHSQDEKCRAHSQLFLSELRNKTLWAVKMWDSSAKAPVGVISGSIFQFGNFDECLKTEAPFAVQFCITHVSANIPSKYWDFRVNEKIPPGGNAWSYIANSQSDTSKVPRDALAWGLCSPASCNSSDLQEAINTHLASMSKTLSNETAFGVRVYKEFCTKVTDRVEFTPWEIAFWVFLFTLILLTTSSTLADLASKGETKHSIIYKLWMVFSIKQNFGLVVPLKRTSSSPLDVFHGIKFVSILFILYGHRVGVSISLSTMNYDDIENYLINDHKMFFVHTDLVVDTFFFISGLLASYVMMDISTKSFINPLYAILVRISRLAPLYFFLIWFQSTAAFRMGSGPLWNGIARNETAYCIDHWWANVFFFSNYYKTDEMCMPHSWFLPCELHFFILAAILIPTIVKFPKFGKILLGIITVVSAAIPAVIIYVYKVQPLILFYFEFLTQPRKYDSFNKLYIKSHNRATVYLIGTAVGLFLHYNKNSKTRISKMSPRGSVHLHMRKIWKPDLTFNDWNIYCWNLFRWKRFEILLKETRGSINKLTMCGVLAWCAFLFAPMAYGSLYYDLNKTYNAIEDAIFGTLRRVSWAIGLSFFILAHRFGTIPLADFFFSSRLAIFCSRITYGVYLIHFNLITADILKTRSARVFSVHDVIIEGIGDTLKSVAATLVLIFILEIPLKRILREHIFVKQIKELQTPAEVQNVWNVRL